MNCPKCGALRWKFAAPTDRETNHQTFECMSVAMPDENVFEEAPGCLRRQLAQRTAERDAALREVKRLRLRVSELKAALDLVIPSCEWLHHPKQHRHAIGEPCPCVGIVRKAKDGK